MKEKIEKELSRYPDKISCWDERFLKLIGMLASVSYNPFGICSKNGIEVRINFIPIKPGSELGNWEVKFISLAFEEHESYYNRILLEISSKNFNTMKELVLHYAKMMGYRITTGIQPLLIEMDCGDREFNF